MATSKNGEQQNQSSSILNIPAEALSNFNSVQPQRAQQQQMMQQYRSNLNASVIQTPDVDVSINGSEQ